MSTQSTVPSIRFYSKFFESDWLKLPEHARDALAGFLKRLQEDPFNPDILVRSEKRGGFFAAEFAPSYVVYWSLRSSSDSVRPPSAGDVETIDVLKLAKTSEIE